MTSAIAVFTHESLDDVFARGGTGYWVTKATRAANYPVAVCVRNLRHPKAPHDVPHRAAFVIGKVAGVEEVVLRPGDKPRVLIRFSEYAVIKSGHDAWGASQNPVWYTSTEELGIDLNKLEWQPMPAPAKAEAVEFRPEEIRNEVIPDSVIGILAAAKEELSEQLGVAIGNIEITIRV